MLRCCVYVCDVMYEYGSVDDCMCVIVANVGGVCDGDDNVCVVCCCCFVCAVWM